MTQTGRNTAFLLGLLLLVAAAGPATAQITVLDVKALPTYTAAANSAAFDATNQVYLMLERGTSARGRFYDKNGVAISGSFLISQESPAGTPFIGWTGVTFGGPPSDPVFLVTYGLIVDEKLPLVTKYGRLIRYHAGAAPDISAASRIVDINGEWYMSEKAQAAWDGEQFVVGSRVKTGGAAYPVPQVNRFDRSGNVSAPLILGDYQDYFGSPAVACNSNTGLCLITGFGGGIPFGSTGGSYARLVNGRALTPAGNLFYVDNHASRMEDQAVTFVAHTGQFLTTWWRAGYLDARVVSPAGALGPLDTSRSFGPGVGDNGAMGYNAATRTSLCVTRYSPPSQPAGVDLYAVELGDNGQVIRSNNVTRIVPWDGRVPSYLPALAVDAINGRWFGTFVLTDTGHGALVQGTIDTSPPPPPPPALPPPTISAVSPTSGPANGGTFLTVTGTNFSAGGTTVTIGSVAATAINVSSGTSLTAVTPAGTVDSVDVTVTTASGSQALANAFTYTPAQHTAISLVGSKTLPTFTAAANSVAFDSTNQVYLMLERGSTVRGRFYDKDGVAISASFLIALESPSGTPFIGWTGITFGGPPSDPVFLVTYGLIVDEKLPLVTKYGRLVRYHAGAAPDISAPSAIADINGEWYTSEKAQAAWDGEQFLVGTRIKPAGALYPVPQVNRFDRSGNVSAAVVLGDFLDYYGSPAVACNSNTGLCLIAGFGGGIPFGSTGGSYARLVNGRTLQPQGSLFYLDDHSARMEDQAVTYFAHTGRFLATWWRAGFVDSRLVNPDGSLGALDLTRSFGPGAGDAGAMTYNPATQTALLVTRYSPPPQVGGVDLYAVELAENGWAAGLSNVVRLTPWDGLVPSYLPALAADPVNGRWLATYVLTDSGHSSIIQGTGAIQPVITWPSPTAIVLGTPLSGTQLRATATVPGTFVYTPPAGTVLPAGTYTLSVTFTPTDTANYATATSTVTLAVVSAARTLTVGPASLRFTAVKAAGSTSLTAATGGQTVTVAFTGASGAWTASTSAPWLALAGASGSGPGQFTVSIVNPGNVIGGSTSLSGTLTIASPIAVNSPSSVPVTLTVTQTIASTSPPIGLVDSPLQNANGQTGSIGVTGWVVDDVGVKSVKLYRNCLAFEPAADCAVVNGVNAVYLGDATLVAGARPDIESRYATYPQAYQAGWGYLMLTSLLPDLTRQQLYGGVGTVTLYVLAEDVDSHQRWLGRNFVTFPTETDQVPTTITMANDSLAKPFGAIDTPTPGQTVSGGLWNFGWTLTPDANTTAGAGDILMPLDGSTQQVFIDGVEVGRVSFANLCRGTVGSPVTPGLYCNDDVASIFGNLAPQPLYTPRSGNATRYRNLDVGRGSIAAYFLDTTTLTNGVHTIVWGVTDSAGRAEGIGSRYFTVLNAPSAAPVVASAASVASSSPVASSGGATVAAADTLRDAPAQSRGDAAGLTALRAAAGEVWGRAGFTTSDPYSEVVADATGVRRVQISNTGRVELRLGPVERGYLVANDTLRDLPPGSQLDPATGEFTWAPGLGYHGTYRLAFVNGSEQIPVEVTIRPMEPASSGESEIRMAVDTPRAGERLSGAVVIEGWALDPRAWTGSGIDAVHVWAQRVDVPAALPQFLGAAALGGSRPDVAQAYGPTFGTSGFTLAIDALPPGSYDITVFVWNRRTARWEDARATHIDRR